MSTDFLLRPLFFNKTDYVFRDIGEIILAVNRENRQFFKFEETAAEIFRLIEKGLEVFDISREVCKAYNCDEMFSEVKSDVENFVLELAALGIVAGDNQWSELETTETTVAVSRQGTSSIDENEVIDYFSSRMIPYSATWEITSLCNLKCSHCYCATPGLGAWTVNKARTALEEMMAIGVIDIEFTGGECLAHPDFFEILSLAYDRGFIISILTNGSLLSDERAKLIADVKPRNVQISVYSLRDGIHDGITRTPGSLQKTLKAIDSLQSFGIRPTIACPLTRINKESVDELHAWATKKGLELKFSVKLSKSENNERIPEQLRIQSRDFDSLLWDARVNPYLRDDIRTLSRVDKSTRMICQAGFRNFSLDAYGNLFPCNSLRMPCGNIISESLSHVWKNSSSLARWRKVTIDDYPKCASCDAKDVCSPCPADHFSDTGLIDAISQQDCSVGWKTYCAWRDLK
ncbi:PqqD family peptide modification chaperone [Thiocapsa rosea]|uniref:Radical SAM protein with 4Fe4S-binding SPASM domain n=1 Tax=Thiocapsa rosea TaxID=69360 RepID=A0A495UKN0_9GAMM|nr:PqqD family peptide modification chaperone [Thiocapsa rosea]RKT37864.1 radical SAM protein with 4Fe4S-binding SPASM domain [Thiocapsa rosea]